MQVGERRQSVRRGRVRYGQAGSRRVRAVRSAWSGVCTLGSGVPFAHLTAPRVWYGRAPQGATVRARLLCVCRVCRTFSCSSLVAFAVPFVSPWVRCCVWFAVAYLSPWVRCCAVCVRVSCPCDEEPSPGARSVLRCVATPVSIGVMCVSARSRRAQRRV